MKGESSGLIIGISIGVVIGVLLAIFSLFCFRYHRKRSQIGNSSSRRAATIPIRTNGADSCTMLSDSTIGPESPVKSGRNGMSFWLEGFRRSNVVSASGILEYSYKYAFLEIFCTYTPWCWMRYFLIIIISLCLRMVNNDQLQTFLTWNVKLSIV